MTTTIESRLDSAGHPFPHELVVAGQKWLSTGKDAHRRRSRSPEAVEVDDCTRQRTRVERMLAERCGVALEVPAEGWVADDSDAALTNRRWPDSGAADTTALGLGHELRACRLRGGPTAGRSDRLRDRSRRRARRSNRDFGTGGVAVANIVMAELGARPWRLDAGANS